MRQSLGTAIIAILVLAAGFVGMVITMAVAYLPANAGGVAGSTSLIAGMISAVALIIGLVLLLIWLIKGMYEP